MSLPFTTAQFLDVFRQYNTSVWPMQLVLGALALAAIVAAARGGSGRLVTWYLAGQWAWTGIVYHWVFFARINPAARLFGAVWLAGALAFAWNALGAHPLSFRTLRPWRLAVGGSLIVYALVVYPVLGHFGGRAYPFAPTYGAPCPVTIVTIGLLWLAAQPFSRALVVVPVLWAVVGSSAFVTLGVREDLGLLVAGVSAVLLVFLPKERQLAAPQCT